MAQILRAPRWIFPRRHLPVGIFSLSVFTALPSISRSSRSTRLGPSNRPLAPPQCHSFLRTPQEESETLESEFHQISPQFQGLPWKLRGLRPCGSSYSTSYFLSACSEITNNWTHVVLWVLRGASAANSLNQWVLMFCCLPLSRQKTVFSPTQCTPLWAHSIKLSQIPM